MQRYYEAKLTVEAVQLTRQSHARVIQWCKGRAWSLPPTRSITGLTIDTPYGPQNVPYDYWIIKRADGTFTWETPHAFDARFKEAK